MPKILVTVVSHNGGSKLKNLINSFKEHPAGMDFDLLVVDSATDNVDDLVYIEDLKCGHIIRLETIMVYRKEVSTFDTGGYFDAWRSTKGMYDYYLFLHDDCVMMENFWLHKIFYQHRLEFENKVGVLALAEVHGNWHEGQLTFVRRNTGMEPDVKIPYPMGPIFFTSKEVMLKVEFAGFIKREHEPTQKVEVEAWEISWGHIFYKLGIPFTSLMGPHPGAVHPDHYKPGHIIKHDISLRT